MVWDEVGPAKKEGEDEGDELEEQGEWDDETVFGTEEEIKKVSRQKR